MKKLFVLIGLWGIVLYPCAGQNIDSIRGAYWINVDYIRDMENYLPCECADSINYWISVYVATKLTEDSDYERNTQIPEVKLNRILQTEPGQFYIVSETATRYVISEDNNKFYDLTLKDDTLLLIDNIRSQKFVKQSHLINNNKVDNVVLLNKALTMLGYPAIKTILKTDSLELDCAPSWGNINLVYSFEKRSLYWVLEISEGYLHIYKVINPMRDPLDPVLKKEIKRLKWVTKGKERKPHIEEYPIFVSPK